ncbi:MAG: hypothetical protein CVT90_01315 [Candidatus Altiarchaeales archaeon HGW-Altiarchaeales-3]|nr:MAG: hypothetical protein CVT90_01315 [Candidatus Altiarchaeales archaeon HGW-Altiarchaeales-3]
MVQCSSSGHSFAGREIKNRETEKNKEFKGYGRIGKVNGINESVFNETVLILNRAKKGVILLIECNSIPLRNELIENLKEQINFKFYDIILDEKNKNLPARVNLDFESKKIDKNTVVLVHKIENAMPEIIGYLNWNREIFLKLNLRTIIFCPTFIMDEIMINAPDFYRFSHRITIKEKDEFPGVTEMQAPSMVSHYYKDVNELKNNIKIQERLLGSVKDDYKLADISFNLGNLYLESYDYDRSIEYFKNSREYYEKLKDKKGILRAIMGEGLVYSGRNRWEDAIKCYEESLEIALGVGDKAGEAECYTNLGAAYQSLGDFKKAVVFHENSLKINKEIGDIAGESACYGNLGLAYDSLGDFKKAIKFHENSLKINKEIGDIAGESKCYTNLGVAYRNLGDFKKAIEFYENSLKINKEIGDIAGESKCYTNLGTAYDNLGDFKKAIVFHENSLKIKKEIGDKAGESKCYGNLGNAYYGLGDFKKALEFYLNAEKIFKEIGQQHYLKILYENIAIAYEKMNNNEKAEEYKTKAKNYLKKE